MAKKKQKAAGEKPKKKVRAVELDEDDDVDADDGDDFVAPRKPSRNDAYTGMLLIGLVCLIAATVLLVLDSSDMTAAPLANPTVTVPALATPPAAPAL
jgi:hypothetical protein